MGNGESLMVYGGCRMSNPNHLLLATYHSPLLPDLAPHAPQALTVPSGSMYHTNYGVGGMAKNNQHRYGSGRLGCVDSIGGMD